MEKGHSPFIESVFVAIDRDTTNQRPFAHALAIAVVNRCALTLFLPAPTSPLRNRIAAKEENLPEVRRTLERWRLLPPNSDRGAVFRDLSVQVVKMRARGEYGRDCRAAITEKKPELVVVAAESRTLLTPRSHPGFAKRFARGTVGEPNERVLYVPSGGRGFVEPTDGYLSLRRILVAGAEASTLPTVLATAIWIAETLGDPPVTIQILGAEKPDIPKQRENRAWTVEASPHEGDPTDSILSAARGVELVVIPAAATGGAPGPQSGIDTDLIIAAAPCPVLTVPIG